MAQIELERQEDPSGSLALLLAREAVLTTLTTDIATKPLTVSPAPRKAAMPTRCTAISGTASATTKNQLAKLGWKVSEGGAKMLGFE